MQIYSSGTLFLTIIEAKLTQDHDLFGKQDPYCKVHHKGILEKTPIHNAGGLEPIWNYKMK